GAACNSGCPTAASASGRGAPAVAASACSASRNGPGASAAAPSCAASPAAAPPSRSRSLFPMIRVLIVDDHPIVREGVATVLERARDLEVVGSAGTVDEGLRLVTARHPDVLLLDLKLPGAEGGDSVATFAARVPAVVVFTAYDADDDVFRAIRGGARGYLL